MEAVNTGALSYKLEVFEGPLDLLLTLISKNKLNIYDIPISTLLEQYMEQIERMQAADLDVASEFLEMAARLVHIKSVSLLPKHEEEEELRRELTGQLLEYQQCKEMAEKLRQCISFDRLFREQAPIPVDHTYTRQHAPAEMLAAYLSAMGRKRRLEPPSAESFSGIVTKKIVSVTSQIIFVLRSVWKRRHISFRDLFRGKKDSSERIAAFLAVLELVKGKRLRVEGDGEDCEIHLIHGGE
ncbi:MAG: segregation/condensation protein A [Clostridia bacterium]|nr:segregation/condensation protein A [Clostridia bacterium]